MKLKKVNLPTPVSCPFCGHDEFRQKFLPWQRLWWIECSTCKAQGPPHPRDVESVDLWNMRAENNEASDSCPFCGIDEFKQKFSPSQQLWWIECFTCRVQGPPHQNDVGSVDLWKMRTGNNEVASS
jgi:hypothetical protein